MLSQNGNRLVTCCPATGGVPKTVYFWNVTNGQLIRKWDVQLDVQEAKESQFGQFAIDISPDGSTVLIAYCGNVKVWFPEEGSPPKVLGTFGEPMMIAFSPSRRSAVTCSLNTLRWWNTADWHLL
jgi:WD40 repeat protein